MWERGGKGGRKEGTRRGVKISCYLPLLTNGNSQSKAGKQASKSWGVFPIHTHTHTHTHTLSLSLSLSLSHSNRSTAFPPSPSPFFHHEQTKSSSFSPSCQTLYISVLYTRIICALIPFNLIPFVLLIFFVHMHI